MLYSVFVADKALQKAGELLLDIIGWVLKVISKAGLWIVNAGYEVFAIICIIGIYFIMAGNKEKGTKITSGAFIMYIILKAVFSVYD